MGRVFGTPIINVPTLFQELAGLKGHVTSRVLKIKGFGVLRDRGSPQVNRGFLRSGVSKTQRFQGPRDEGSS